MSSVLSFQKKFINSKKDIKCIVKDVASNYDKSFKSILIGSEILKQLLFSSLFRIPMSMQCQMDVFHLTKERFFKMPCLTNKKCNVCNDQITNSAYYGNKLCISCQQFYCRSVTAMNS